MTTLTVTPRETTGSRATKKLSETGNIPAILYSAKHEATPISIPLSSFSKVLRDQGESAVVKIAGLGGDIQALVHEVDYSPVTNLPRHADLLVIEKGAKMEVSVPLSFIGEAPAVKAGARLVKVLHELTVFADAAHLPQEIEVDITVLAEIGDQVHVSDLALPSGVETKEDGDEVVVLAQAPDDEEEGATATIDMAEIEVEKKGKTDDEEAEG